MLSPSENRIDYGEKLRPPTGFELTHAVATTFSLDLEMLMCLPVALCFDNTLEGEWKGEPMALLEAISQLEGKLKVFFQQGNIKTPDKFRKLFTLLEPNLIPVPPEGPFASFHPKIWLMRFESAGKAVVYRLLVLTRNLTSDRSWDLAVAMEGAVGKHQISVDEGLLLFLQGLAPHDAGFKSWLPLFKKELLRIDWKTPKGFSGKPRMLPGNPQERPLDFGGKTDSVLVMSPFLHESALELLASYTGTRQRWLFSRASELDRLGPETLQDWRCYSLNEQIVHGEEASEESGAEVQELHAKLIIAGNGNTFHWHIGSANATAAALGTQEKAPRNTEFMIRLSGKTPITSVIDELVGKKPKPKNIFLEHVFTTTVADASTNDDRAQRLLSYALIKAEWHINAKYNKYETYDCTLQIVYNKDHIPKVPKGYHVLVGQLSVDGSSKRLEEKMTWSNLALDQISAFMPVKIICDATGDSVASLVIRAELAIEGGDNRADFIFKALVSSKERFMAYVLMLLEDNSHKPNWFDVDFRKMTGNNEIGNNISIDGPVLEMLLRSASRTPENIVRIKKLLQRLEKASVVIPDDFQRLWNKFKGLA